MGCSVPVRRRWLWPLATVAALMLASGQSMAQEEASDPVASTFELSEPADLEIAFRPIITLRAEVFGNKPHQRVENIHKRIDQWFAEHDRFTLTDSALFGGRAILIGGSPLLFIAAQDIDPTQDKSVDAVVRRTRERLELALGEYQELRDGSAMMRNVGWVSIYTVLFIGALWGLGRLRRGVRDRTEQFITKNISRTGLTGILDRSQTVALVAHRLVLVFIGLLMLVAIYFWLTAILGRIPITRSWGEQMFEILAQGAIWIFEGILNALPDLLVLLVIYLITRSIARVVGSVFDRIARNELEVTWLDANIAAPVKRIVVLVVWLFALVIAYPYIPGSESKAFQGIGVLAGLMLSLGSSSVVSQAASGLVIMFSRVIRVGEVVAIGEQVTGVIKRIGYFNTIVLTGYGEEVTVPNSDVLSNNITNRSRHGGKGLQYTTGVTIGYDSPWRQVHAMLLQAAASTPGIASIPEPVVNQHALEDFYVNYKLTFVIEGPFRPTLTALHANIQDTFNANNVQIMSPHYEKDPREAKVVPPQDWDPGLRSGSAVGDRDSDP